MIRRLKIFTKLRPFLPIIIGVSLGFSLSIVQMPISSEDCVHLTKDRLDRKLSSISNQKNNKLSMDKGNADFEQMDSDKAEQYRKDREFASPVYDTLEDFEPRIITDPELKPKINFDAESNKKKIVRTRYISTELGIRERLVSSILTSSTTYSSMAVAVNKTFSHHMENVIFFAGINQPSNQKPPAAPGMTLVVHPNSNPTQIMFETLVYLHSKFGEEYDWFYIATDHTYSEGPRISNIIDHTSINRRLYMGKPMSFHDSTGTIEYCSLENGIIISRLLLIDVVPSLRRCMDKYDGESMSSDVWLGKCIRVATRGAVDCVMFEEGSIFRTFDLPDQHFDIENEKSQEFTESVTVSGVKSPEVIFMLHKRFAQIEIADAYNEIEAIQNEIISLAPKLPEGERELSWPIGINAPFKPSNRWDIIVWDYFTEEYTLTCPGEVPKCELAGIDKLDIQNILHVAMERLNAKYNPKGLLLEKKELVNGYRRFDPQRGMEYILDLLLDCLVEEDNSRIEISHRVNMLRPLSDVEIVPMPYVTESAKINVILALTKQDRSLFQGYMSKFAKVCLENNENVGLSIVFIYDTETAQAIHEDDIFAKEKSLLVQYETRYKKSNDKQKLIPWVSIKTEVLSQIKIMDIVAKKYPTDALFLLMSVAANINSNFLNRCRMNTIAGWQAFFPLPFSQYNPEILYKNVPIPDIIDIKPNNGHFDIYSFDEVCIYNSDYMASRTKLTASSEQASVNELVDKTDVYDMMIKYSQLHIFRAVEPQLTRRYMYRTCNERNGADMFQRCERSNSEGLASRTQLALELFSDDPEEKKN